MQPDKRRFASTLVLTALVFPSATRGEQPTSAHESNTAPAWEVMSIDMDPSLAGLRAVVDRFSTDHDLVRRSERIPLSPQRRANLRAFLKQWQTRLERVAFGQLDLDGQIDYVLLRKELQHELDELEFTAERDAELTVLLPFSDAVLPLLEAREAMQPVSGREASDRLDEVRKQVVAARETLADRADSISKPIARRGLQRLEALQRSLQAWFEHYAGYDPEFTWWATTPFRNVEAALKDYREAVRERIVGRDEDEIIGDPIGREALLRELAYELICYSPEELIEIAKREFAWCERELLQAAGELGFGDDWRKALEHVKNQHVAPGDQPALIREHALAAIRFLDDHDLVTIPPLCRTSWRIGMMSPERQRVNPYFTGGEVISVSFPTDGMSHEEKLMSLRSNNIHFCWATVHHELIPGHHLQGFMAQRYRSHRQRFRTPFLVEGWALYWEMLLWDMNFQRSPEDRVGMLFWRMHRCARIMLSLGFHLDQQQPPQMVDFLVNRVGHERSAAEAEVRRWVAGNYGPLYQAAYMLGGLQIRALRGQLVESGIMTNREFHDAILRENAIPIELIRAKLTATPLTPTYQSSWRFYDQPSEP